MEFYVEQKVLDLGVKIIGVEIDGIDNKTISDEYLQWRKDEVGVLLEKYKDFDVKQDEVLEAFYTLHEKVNVPRRKNIPASENLIKLLIKKQGLFEINKAVDIYNIISMESKLALGAHDIDKLSGNITLRLTDGTEKFRPLGSEEDKPVKPGEYSYIDDNNEILCYFNIILRCIHRGCLSNLFHLVERILK